MGTSRRLKTTDHRAAMEKTRASDQEAGITERAWYRPPTLPKYIPRGTYRVSSIEIYREHIDILTSDTSVAIRWADFLHGVTNGGKNWYRWNTSQKKILSVKPDVHGRMRANFYSYTPSSGFRNFISVGLQDRFFLDASDEVRDLLSRQMPDLYKRVQELDREKFVDMSYFFYPGLLSSSIGKSVLQIPYRLRHALRNETAVEMALSGFGKKHYRKDIVKSLAEAKNDKNVALAMYTRHLLKTDWLVEIMRSDARHNLGVYDSSDMEYRRFAKLLRKIPEHRRRRFVQSLSDNNGYFNQDAMRLAIHLTDEDFDRIRTVSQVHEMGREIMNRRRREYQIRYQAEDVWTGAPQVAPVNEIELNDLTKTYHDVYTSNGLHLVAPQHVDTLREWGIYMSNCIAGYGSTAAKGTSNLGGVYDGDKLIANFEITSAKTMRQLLGRFNRNLEIEVQRDIIDTLLAQESITKNGLANAWGVDPKVLETKDN